MKYPTLQSYPQGKTAEFLVIYLTLRQTYFMLTNHSATNVDVNTYIQFLCAIT